ncbi:MAG: hypothetical protein QOI56_460 [Actinomycetota bacterium]|nr:hypothetical protein [Actinomycetota bacterium]
MPAPSPSGGCDCPSAQPDMANARVFGVRHASAGGPRTGYLERSVEATPELLATTAPAPPTHVLRLAATCEESRCAHFDGTDCGLARNIVALLPPVVGVLPRCAIRPQCRWFHQEGRAACLRCPQVVTEMSDAPIELRRAAEPPRSAAPSPPAAQPA